MEPLINLLEAAKARLSEVGRKISAKNEKALRTAMEALTAVLSQLEQAIATEEGVTESAIEGDCVPLIEAALSEAATARLKLIQPGHGSSGYYSPKVLEGAAGVFKKGTQMFWDHQTSAEEAAKPEGSLDRLAGELLEDAKYDANGSAGAGLYAEAKIFDRFKDSVKDLAPHIGVSIRASGVAKDGEIDGKKTRVIERIAAAKSVDFVTRPGAGGQILQLFESAGRRLPVATSTDGGDMTEEQIKALVEAQVKPLRDESAVLRETNARLTEKLALRDAKDIVSAKLKTITMPDATRARLTESLSINPPIKDGAIDVAAFHTAIEAAAKAEMDYLGIATGGRRITGMGSAGTTAPPEVKPADLVKSFAALGLSEAAAKIAAEGRTQ